MCHGYTYNLIGNIVENIVHIIRFGYTACSKNLLKWLFFIIMISQTKILNMESILWTRKKKEDVIFLSVEDQSTIDKKWKKSRIPWFLCFSFLWKVFVFYCNSMIWAVFYLVGNANTDCADERILNNNYHVFKDWNNLNTEWWHSFLLFQKNDWNFRY